MSPTKGTFPFFWSLRLLLRTRRKMVRPNHSNNEYSKDICSCLQRARGGVEKKG